MSQSSDTTGGLEEQFANSPGAQQIGRDYVDAQVYKELADRFSDDDVNPVDVRNEVLAGLAESDDEFADNFGFLIPDGMEPAPTSDEEEVVANEGFPSLSARTRQDELEAEPDEEIEGDFPALDAESRLRERE